MKQKQMMIIAIVCGLICAACVALFMVSVRGEADAARAEALSRFGGEQVEAYVATRDIVAGERVDLSAVETKLWVADLLPERAIRSSSDAVGKTATSSIYKGEVITSGRFEAGQDSIDVPAGKQAVSVPAKAVQAVGGAIRAGMQVDVYSAGGSTTVVIANGVTVLDVSVGSSGSLSSGDGGWITLAIEPEKVQELIDASNKTTLYFTLPGESVALATQNRESDDENPTETSANPIEGGNPSIATTSSGKDAGKSSSASSSQENNSKTSKAGSSSSNVDGSSSSATS